MHAQAAALAVPYDELIRQAAQGEVVYNDDTPNKILELGTKTRTQLLAAGQEPGERTGVETRHVIDILKEVYHNDAVTKAQKMTDQQRLSYHIAHSGPLMTDLETWLRAQITERQVEPNSGLGAAMTYMIKAERWARFTLFLRVPGAPLDNTLRERALKKLIVNTEAAEE